MKLGIIVGSHRKKSQSAKVGEFMVARWKHLIPHGSTYTLDLGKNPLPLWDEEVWENPPSATNKWRSLWTAISVELRDCDAFVIISPEYAGMASAAIKNFFLLCAGKEIAHKPSLLTTVSSSIGGAYPISELRASSYKNTFACYLPDHILVRNAEKVLNDLENPTPDEAYIRARIDYSLKVLHQYGLALKTVRDSGVLDLKTYPFGM